MLSLCAEPAYPEPLPSLAGNVAKDDAALHSDCAALTIASLSRRLSRPDATTGKPVRWLRSRTDQRRTDDAGVVAQFGAGELDSAAGHSQRFTACIVGRHVEQDGDRFDDAAAHYDPRRIQQADDGSESITKVPAGLVDRLQHQFITLLDRVREHPRADGAALGPHRCGGELRRQLAQHRLATALEITHQTEGDRRARGIRFDVPSAAAAAETTTTIDDEVPNLARAAADPSHEFAADDDRAAHTGANETAEKVRYPLTGAECKLSGRGHLHVIAEGRGNAETFA